MMKRKDRHSKFFEESTKIISSMPIQVLDEAEDYQKYLVEKMSKQVQFNIFQGQRSQSKGF